VLLRRGLGLPLCVLGAAPHFTKTCRLRTTQQAGSRGAGVVTSLAQRMTRRGPVEQLQAAAQQLAGIIAWRPGCGWLLLDQQEPLAALLHLLAGTSGSAASQRASRLAGAQLVASMAASGWSSTADALARAGVVPALVALLQQGPAAAGGAGADAGGDAVDESELQCSAEAALLCLYSSGGWLVRAQAAALLPVSRRPGRPCAAAPRRVCIERWICACRQ
jgi:hypothetical protein